INLLPTKAAKKQEAGKNQLILFALVLIGAFVGNYYWYDDRDTANEQLKGQAVVIQAEIRKLDEIIGEVKNIAKEKQALEDKLKVLDTLKRSRTGPVKMLDALSTAIPKNVWLSNMNENGSQMNLEGNALSNDDLAEFMKSLANVVWTPEGMGRLVEGTRRGATTSRVELSSSGQIKDIPVGQVGVFFTDITLKKASQATQVGGDVKAVQFSLTFKANYSSI
ncbi:MAG: PilN domain-containing protein, partial [Myxococcales bacterium]